MTRLARRRAAPAALVLPILALLAGCGGKEATSKVPPAEGTKPADAVSVKVAPAKKTAIPRKVEFVGSLAGIEQLTLASEIEGLIGKVHVDLGDPVRRGQVLLSVTADEFLYRRDQARAEVEQVAARLGISPDAETADVDGTSAVRKAAAEYRNAGTDLERRRGLFARSLIARKEVDDAEARYQVAEANLGAAREEANNLLATLRSKRAQFSLAEKKWRDAQVRSPIDGWVEARLVSTGEYLKAGTAMFRLVNDRPIRMVGEVPELYAASLKGGLGVELAVDGQPGRVFRGTLRRISPASNVANRSIQVEALFPNASRELHAGAFGKGAILLGVDQGGVTVPKQAVVTFAGIEKVFVVADGVARERKVRLGADLGDSVEVAEGLSAGEAVAVTNTGKMADGIRVGVEGGNGR